MELYVRCTFLLYNLVSAKKNIFYIYYINSAMKFVYSFTVSASYCAIFVCIVQHLKSFFTTLVDVFIKFMKFDLFMETFADIESK